MHGPASSVHQSITLPALLSPWLRLCPRCVEGHGPLKPLKATGAPPRCDIGALPHSLYKGVRFRGTFDRSRDERGMAGGRGQVVSSESSRQVDAAVAIAHVRGRLWTATVTR